MALAGTAEPKLVRTAALLLALLSTNGCVAAAAPMLAGGLLARGQADRVSSAAPPASSLVQLPAAAFAAPGAEPETSPPDSPLARFANYVVARAGAGSATGTRGFSVLIDPQSLAVAPRALACKAQPLAVAIDLDPGHALFDLGDPPASAPGLAEALDAIRAAGITIFWTSALPVSDADRLYAVLRATALDLDGTDRILLARSPGETSQDRRLTAAREWCFIALAGDRPGDFEVAIDFLRDPEGPIARAMAPLFGAGWFVIPNPID